MEPRLNFFQVAPKAREAMLELQKYVNSSSLDHKLLELAKIRASQINECAFCLDMHTKDARALGETEQRLYTLAAWRETPFFSERERVALEWTEALTLVADGHVPDEVYEKAVQEFSPEELADLTLAITTINAWNRICVAFRTVPGSYTRTDQKLEKEG